MTAEGLGKLRIAAFGLTGGICLLYAVLAVLSGRPDPLPVWIPGLAGVAACGLMVVSSWLAGGAAAEMAWDEGYAADSRRAATIGFWVAVLMYPLFAVFLVNDIVSYELSFAVMGLLTGAAYLLSLTWFEVSGRI